MDSLLVISDEAALPETLASELPNITVEHATIAQAEAHLNSDKQCLVIFDGEPDRPRLTGAFKASVIWVARPARLSELLYTIRERLQGKNTIGREDMPLPEGLRFSASERLIRSADGLISVTLTEKETDLLSCLLEAAGQVVARDLLLKRVWGYADDIATHTLETHIYRLRGKLRQASEGLDIFSSDVGGYCLKK